MSLEPGIHETARRLVGMLDRMRVPYAVGGAVAMAFAGFVRATRDLDVLALVPAVRTQELAEALAAEGFMMRGEDLSPIPPDAGRMAASTRECGHFKVWRGDIRVEVFSPRVPLQDSILRRRVKADLGDFSFWVTTAEDLVLLKMVFHRPKDIEDVRRLLAANRNTLDIAYLREWAAKTLEAAVAEELSRLMDSAGMPA
jgi:hypothetical protein